MEAQTCAQVKAGDKLTAEWHHTLDSAGTGDAQDPIDKGHLGPVMVYMAKVDDALTTKVTGLKWFKIYQDGMDSKGQWGVSRLYNNKGKVDFILPACVQSGQYLLRSELIALHGASNYPGAQLYMECAQLNVSGGGTANPPTVSFPGAYKGSDPGIKFQLYYPTPTAYTIPGPTPFTC
ncbi:lytic polysaccharide monooxygenase [Melanomma pulvis-pyrius CBS 109.77]|uniref:AA9 family lytic polysaccharide monooxygenase n=1 Tax=Melanomma pulvis-pyrius CBS 109.77 TaxID=1314802 RepID=A0A6A6XXU4_9PLEO|nr:lytic polysaccharide monooxygenase [Melanomma pulvis-pyrius CBS 109.77]